MNIIIQFIRIGSNLKVIICSSVCNDSEIANHDDDSDNNDNENDSNYQLSTNLSGTFTDTFHKCIKINDCWCQ